MPNIKISDLETIAPGFDPDLVFVEVQNTVAGEPASRKATVTELTAGASPLTATYVTVTANAILPNERILTAGTDIDIVDGGANGNITISLASGASYFRLSATGRVVGSDAGTSQTGDNVILGGALAGDLNIADGVIALGQNALAAAAALDFVGSIAIGRNAGALMGDTRDPWIIIGDGAAANIPTQSFHDGNTVIGTRALGALATGNTQNATILGHDACSDMTGASGLGIVNTAVIIGNDAGTGNVGASISSSVLIGSRVCSDLQVGGVSGSVVIGNSTGESMGGASLNVLIGSNNTANAINIDSCIVLGCNTFAIGVAQTANQIILGHSSIPGILTGETNVLIGNSMGITGTQLDYDHCIIIGHLAGNKFVDDQDIFAIEQPQSNTSNLARPYLFGNLLNGNLALLNIAAMTGGAETGTRINPSWADAAPTAGQGVFSMYGAGTDLDPTTDADFVHFYVASADSALTLRYPGGGDVTLLHDGTDSILANSAGDMQLVGTGAVVLAPNSVEGLRLTEDNSGVLQVPSASVAITANAGGGQVGAVPLIHSYNVVTVVASFNDSVRLPDVFAINSIVYVKNDGANRVAIFPASGDDLGEGVDALISLPTGSSYAFIATVANSTWTQLVDSGIATALLGLNNNGPQIADIAPTDVIPTILPNKVDIDTGLGWTGSDIWGLIAGGVQAFQLRELGGGVVQAPSASLAVTAFAGGGQVSATPLIDSYNVITVVATAGDSVRLPSAFSANPSALVYIKNDDATEAADVFPASGDDLGAGVDTAVSLLAGQSLTFIATVANSTWTPLIVDTAGGAGISGEFDNLLLSQTPGVHAASPTLRFGDGNTGFYENSDNQLAVSIGGVPELFFDSLGIRTVVSSGPTFANIAASSTVPTLIPNQQEQDTGIGWTSADRIAIISGGSLVAEFLNTAGVEQVIIPLQNNASTPSLAFGDGNTGFFESADNILTTSIGGTSILEQVSNGIRLAAANGPMLLNETPSATNAVIIPNKGDGSTGIGQAASNQLTLVANNVLALNAHGVNSGALIDTSRQTGITAFAGGGQGSAVHLVNSVCIIATVATTGDSVRLANQFRPGATISIKNNGANAADVFPSSGDNLGLGIDTAYSLPAGKWVTFMGVT
ncbi:MAG: hypothetical protein NWE89_15950, partial [Candidatus Bathyarchaeota archaeon]|nr:hypothetical protein [Candidatus Bathyarchaeota archaeon]